MPELTLSLILASRLVKPLSGGIPGCEWDPDTRCGSSETSNHYRYRRAIFLVDAGEDGLWKVCTECAQRAPFKRLPKRKFYQHGKTEGANQRGKIWRTDDLGGAP